MSTKQGLTLNFYIYFLTSCSFFYLVNLNYISNYNIYKLNFANVTLPILVFILWII
jgi:hypothetical protein